MKKRVKSNTPQETPVKKVAVIVAHPDDETLWAGGTIMSHPEWQVYVLSLCRGDDRDRAPKFHAALHILRASGKMGFLDDGVVQYPLPEEEVQRAILTLLPTITYDLIITHDPSGEYTFHQRHVDVSKAVITLWTARKLESPTLWTFAYHDGNRSFYPRAVKTAPIKIKLTQPLFAVKYDIINRIYGYPKEGWEVLTTPRTEAFWCFSAVNKAREWLIKGGVA